MEDKIILNNTELGIIGKNEMEKLSNFLDKRKLEKVIEKNMMRQQTLKNLISQYS